MLDGTSPRADVTVVLANDHAAVRKGLRQLVESEPGMRVVAGAETVPNALRMARDHLEQAPGTAIVILTMQSDPPFARQAIRVAARGARQSSEPAGPPDDLSDRELEVLRRIALGHTNAEIAEQLYLSIRTIESHRAHIQHKTGRASRAELVRYALEHRLVQLLDT
jgi:two-component system response regulator NreC